ncbi:WXG100 family type VII secretion target [Streptomyces sp. NRRL S-646]|uniref:WXG100 family type VII secretion target n=1 Tax=Streptomyces sp. NRRL S-646 TaxID=1463917 RepID=UPI0004C6F060|nr:WXG100 family type VII secretion target [Streptomyces sp. NRRL S-646]
MSSDYFAVDPDGLAKNAPQVRAFSDQMRQVLSQLESRMNELGDCWGDDPMGKAFAQQYLTPRDQMIDGLKGIVDVLDSTADGLETMAKGFHQTEEQAKATARGLDRGTDTHADPAGNANPSGGSRGHGPAHH